MERHTMHRIYHWKKVNYKPWLLHKNSQIELVYHIAHSSKSSEYDHWTILMFMEQDVGFMSPEENKILEIFK